MANTTYISPVIAAPNVAVKKRTAYDAISVLVAHLREGIDHPESGYTMDLVSIDFNVTTANRITVIVTDPLPQVARYNLTVV